MAPAPLPRWFSVRAKLLLILATLWGSLAWGQDQFTVLHNFGSGNDGNGPWASVTLDQKGNVYGATAGGGDYNAGIVFELAPQPDGEWAETILHSFLASPDDGAVPLGGLALDSSGNLYGTTSAGGGSGEYGTVFELTPGAGGWQETVLHSFGRNDGACCPGYGNAVILDPRGNLYDTGVSVFELLPVPGGWTESILHTFTPQHGDGSGPRAGPIMDSAGNLYGTTEAGGGGPKCQSNYGCGTVYELQPVQVSLGGGWRELILHRFGYSPQDGRGGPGLGRLAMDREGNLYGTAGGGVTGYGTAYKLTPVPATPNGPWQETILYNFEPDGWSSSGVIFGPDGNLYGTAINGGGYGCGIVYKLSPVSSAATGEWQFTLLHSFDVSDGCQPDANLTLGPNGNLYGTAATGGQYFGGVVFEITP